MIYIKQLPLNAYILAPFTSVHSYSVTLKSVALSMYRHPSVVYSKVGHDLQFSL